MRILIADGDKVFLELAQQYLMRSGHEVRTASDGLECADVMFDLEPDLVVLDCDLLWGGSEGVIALMLGHPHLSQTPTILIADEDPRAEFAPLLNSSLAGWLQKPIRLADLLTQIEFGGHSLRFTKHRQESLVFANCEGEES